MSTDCFHKTYNHEWLNPLPTMATTRSLKGDASIAARAGACLALFERSLTEQANLVNGAPVSASSSALQIDNKKPDNRRAVMDATAEKVGLLKGGPQQQVQEQEHEEWAEIQMVRLNIWAGNLGVFAYGHASVEHRLTDCTEIYNVIVQLLDALQANLIFCGCFF